MAYSATLVSAGYVGQTVSMNGSVYHNTGVIDTYGFEINGVRTIIGYSAPIGTKTFNYAFTGNYGTSYTIRAFGHLYGGSYFYSSSAVVTPIAPVAPTVTTQAVTNINETTATGNGNVTSNGSAAITARGCCWALTQTPTIAGNHTHDGTSTGAFTSTLTGLTQGRTYYVRAYATNSVGTSYGTQVSFVAKVTPPVLTGGTDIHLFPQIGWSGITNQTTWTGATHQRWYNKVSTGSTYTLVKTTALPSGNSTNYLELAPNISYNFYCTFYQTGVESQPSNVITINNTVANPIATYSSILIV